MNMMRGGCSSSSSSVSRCQECGNQAKRDCEYMRCRTCCKSRGFECPTHVKSTWIPLSQRRPRQYYFQHPPPPPPNTHGHDHHYHHQLILPNSKRYKPFNLSSSSSSGLQTRDFPGEVKTTATFRCVRMMSGDNVVDQCAYQTVVDIGGHVFKGLLYDQGPIHEEDEDEEEEDDEDEDEDEEDQDRDGCYNSADHVRDHYHHASMQQQQQPPPHQQHQPNLNMSTAPPAAPTNCDAVASPPPPPPPLPPPYPSPFYPFMPGMLYFPYPKS